MSRGKRSAVLGIHTARKHMRFFGRSKAAFAIWAHCPAATTVPLSPSMTPASWWSFPTPQPARTRFPGLLLKVLPILELCRAQTPARRLRSTIKARLQVAPEAMRLCGPVAQFRTWERSEELPVKRTESTISERLSASLTPVPARTLFYGKTALCGTWAFCPATPAAAPTISMTAGWLSALPTAAAAYVLLSGAVPPECSRSATVQKASIVKRSTLTTRDRWLAKLRLLSAHALSYGPARMA